MLRHVALLVLVLSAAGCSEMFAKVAADATADVIEVAEPKLQAHWDVELFRKGLPALLLQMEGVMAVVPTNLEHKVELAKAYALYTYGYLEADYEIAEVAGDFERADAVRARAIALYLRGRDIGLSVLRERDDEVDEMLYGDTEKLARYLKRRFHGRSSAKLLFWTAMGWGGAINIARDDPELISDLATVKTLAQRVVDIDPMYYHGAPMALLGAIEAGLPAALGGNPEKGKEIFERALKKTERKNLIIQVQYARTYARSVGDRELYKKLLQEVVDAPDYGDEVRLANEISKKRARRYLDTMDSDF